MSLLFKVFDVKIVVLGIVKKFCVITRSLKIYLSIFKSSKHDKWQWFWKFVWLCNISRYSQVLLYWLENIDFQSKHRAPPKTSHFTVESLLLWTNLASEKYPKSQVAFPYLPLISTNAIKIENNFMFATKPLQEYEYNVLKIIAVRCREHIKIA